MADDVAAGGATQEARRSSGQRPSLRSQIAKRWRQWFRSLHRDAGYLAVGLTLVYAFSGLAINHIGQWDPNFKKVVEHHPLKGTLPRTEAEASAAIFAQLGIRATVRDAYWDTDTSFQIDLDGRTLVADTETAVITDVADQPRFFLRLANWLHYNRGKAAWTAIADGYAVCLLFLACSGVFMLKGKKGLVGRGAVLVGLGALLPFLYVTLSGGP
jgi:hypothetical protein